MDNNNQCAQGDFFSAHPLSCNWFGIVDPKVTIRKIGPESSVHAATISEVAIYRKTEGTPADSHLENPEDGHRMPFIDNKIAHYLSACQGG